MPADFDPRDGGYVATFVGPLDMEQITDIRAQATERFHEGGFRWAVMDLRRAEINTATSVDDELEQLEKIHRVARAIKTVRASHLRLAMVATDEQMAEMIRLTQLTLETVATPTFSGGQTIERFDDLDEAITWARKQVRC